MFAGEHMETVGLVQVGLQLGQGVDVAKIISFEQALIAFFNREFADLMAKINEKGDFNDEIDAGLKAGIEKFKATQTW